MIINLYSLKDTKAGSFAAPIAIQNDSMAIRYLKTLVNNPTKDDNLSLYPEDFDFYKVGTIDSDNGEIIPKVEFLCNGSSLVGGNL